MTRNLRSRANNKYEIPKLVCIKALLLFSLGANAETYQIGSIDFKTPTPDMAQSFTGSYAITDNVVAGNAGGFDTYTSGGSMEIFNAGGLAIELAEASQATAPSTAASNAAGTVLGVANSNLDDGEVLAFSFNQDVILKQVGFNGFDGATEHVDVSIAGAAAVNYTVADVSLGDVVLPAGETLHIANNAGGTYKVWYITVESIAPPSVLQLGSMAFQSPTPDLAQSFFGDYGYASNTVAANVGGFDSWATGGVLAIANSDGLELQLAEVTQFGTEVNAATNAAGTVLGVVNSNIDDGEAMAFSFNKDVILKQIGFNGFTEASESVDITIADGNPITYTSVHNSLNNMKLAAGETLRIANNAGGAYKLWYLTVDQALPTISAVDRLGSEVSDQGLVDSDSLHISAEVSADGTIFEYKYLVQSNEPSQGEWDAEATRSFYKELFFYRQSENQWLYTRVELSDGTVYEYTGGLQGGTLTSPPDDPISPTDYTAMMGEGFDVTWGKANGLTNVDEAEIVAIAAAGFKHIRLREPNAAPGLFADHLDRQIELLLRHNLLPVIGYTGNYKKLEYETVWVDWYTAVAEHYKYASHKISYNFFIEIHTGTPLDDWDELNSWYEGMTNAVRSHTLNHNVIYCPNSWNKPEALSGLVVPASAGSNYFAEWHRWAGGTVSAFAKKDWTTGTQAEKDAIDLEVDIAVAWTASTGIPTYLGAWMPGQYLRINSATIAEQMGFAQYLLDRLRVEGIPSAINAFSHYYDYINDPRGWGVERMPVIEVLNGAASLDYNDRDGDGLSNDDEVNLYGTNPDHADTDGDNIIDGKEVRFGLDPLNSSDGDPDHSNATAADNDADGMNDAVEIHYGFDPTDASDAAPDPDGDGLTNVQELSAVLDPYGYVSRGDINDALSDLDNDGYGALIELNLGRDPRLKHGSGETTNNRPDPVTDVISATENQNITFNVLDNDSDEDGDVMSVHSVTANSWKLSSLNQSVKGGTVIVNADSTLTYTPPTDYTGTDTLYYIVTDGMGYERGMVTITVN